MEAGDEFAGQHHLGIFRVASGFDFCLECGNLAHRAEGQQLVVAPHQHVADGQQLGEHGRRGFLDTDVIALGLGHFFHTVQPFEQRHGENALRLLAVFALQFAPDQQVELLIGAAEFEVALERHRIKTLHQRVEQFVHGDGHALLEPLGEIVALQQSRQGVFGGQANHAIGAQRLAPLGVVANLGFLRVEHQAGLGVIGLGVGLDLLDRQRRAGGVAPGRIADARGEIADEKNDRVAQILQLPELVEHHGVADMNVGRGGVEAEFDAQRLAGLVAAGQFGDPVGLHQQFGAAAFGDGQCVAHGVGKFDGRVGVHHGENRKMREAGC